MKHLLNDKNKRGFTSIELIVVMVIIAALVLLAVPRFIEKTNEAKMTQIKNDVRVAEDKLTELLIKNPVVYDNWVEADKSILQGYIESKDEQLFGRGGPVLELEAGSYKEVGEKFVENINSQLGGEFFANEKGTVYYFETGLNLGGVSDAGKKGEGHDRPEGHEYDFANSPWEYEDFTYNGTTVTGFSSSGKEKNRNGLVELVIPDKNLDGEPVVGTAYNAFYNITKNLTGVILPDTLRTIGKDSFWGNNITELYIPDSVRTINSGAFHNNGLIKVSIPYSTSISSSAFNGNPNLNITYR